MQKNVSVVITNIIFTVVGVLFFFIGVVVLLDPIRFKEDEVMALITEIRSYENDNGEMEHEVDVRYEYEGINYEVTLDTYNSNMREGLWIPIVAEKNETMNVRDEANKEIVATCFIVIGLLTALVGGVSIIKECRNKKRYKTLKATGKRLIATINRITINTRIAVNEEHPYIIWCSYVDGFSGATFEFKSEDVWNDPYEVCDVGSPIEVWVNPNDYLEYYVDVDSITEMITIDSEW